MRILVFGDSIAQGFYDSQGGWVQRLANEYHGQTLQSMLSGKDFDCEVFNLGVSGDTSPEILSRLDNEIRVRRWQDDPIVTIIAVGINDARHEGSRVVMDVYEFQQTYDKIIEKALKNSNHVLCLGLTAVDEAQTSPWPHSSQQAHWGNNRINLFEDSIKQSAERADISFVPVHDQFLAQLEAGHQLLSDGLHPNEAGHQLVAELIKPSIDNLLAAS